MVPQVCIIIFKIIGPFGTTSEPLSNIVSDTVDAVVSIETCLSVVWCIVLYLSKIIVVCVCEEAVD